MRIAVQTFFDGTQQELLADYVAGVTRILEDRGFAGVWMSEHAVTFDHYDPAYPYPYSDDGSAPEILSEIGMVEPLTALAAMAMHSTKLRLGTGIAILPQRNPLYFAKTAAAIDLLSNGRFIAGVGLGWSAQEFAATNTPFEHRGARMDDYIEVVRTLWCDERAKFEGRYYSLPECIHLPKPARKPHPPFYFGGESAPAMRRVGRYGQGWFAFRKTPDELALKLPLLDEVMKAHGRSVAEIDLVVSPGADRDCTVDDLARYAELGVQEVVVVCLGNSLESFRAEADRLAEALIEPAGRL